jgi:hypothetical protein
VARCLLVFSFRELLGGCFLDHYQLTSPVDAQGAHTMRPCQHLCHHAIRFAKDKGAQQISFQAGKENRT